MRDFQTQQEIWIHLSNGGRIKGRDTGNIWYFNGGWIHKLDSETNEEVRLSSTPSFNVIQNYSKTE